MERVGHDRGGEGRGRIASHCRCIPKEGGRPPRGNNPFEWSISSQANNLLDATLNRNMRK
jgi:hypothetical protein